MIALTRYAMQKIKIGGDIEIMVIEVRGDKVKLGITAPKDTLILRSELQKYDRQEKKVEANKRSFAVNMESAKRFDTTVENPPTGEYRKADE